MFKAKKQLKSIYDNKFVSDISSEAAANCSGGVSFLGSNDPDVILYEDSGLQGPSLNANASIGDGLSNIGTNDGNGGGGINGLNDKISSATIVRGQWQFFFDENFGGSSSPVFGPGDSTRRTLSS